VSVELRDGRRLTGETAIVHGDTANPRPPHELEAKFRALASEALGAERANEVVETVARLEQLKDVRTLTALLTTVP
jgi:2-methylcitrate dehydratase PrpD